METETCAGITKGPWSAYEQKDGTVEIEGYKGAIVARLQEPSSGDIVDNARLIVAAPDLLKALNAVELFASGQPWTGLRDSGAYGPDLCKLIHAAIRRAEGSA